jgi:hypothetical protein
MELFIISAVGTYMEEKIKIPNNITILYLSNETDTIDLLKIQEISDNFIKLDFNKINDYVKNNPGYFYQYNPNEMINDNYFNIMNGIVSICDDFNNHIISLKTVMGLYKLPINERLIENYSFPNNINYKQKELIEKECVKNSIIKNNFKLSDVFVKYGNKKYNMVFMIMASRNKINVKEYSNDISNDCFI